MKTELVHSYSSTSLSNLSRAQSQVSLNLLNGDYYRAGLGGPGGGRTDSLTGSTDYRPCSRKEQVIGCCKEWCRTTFRRKILVRKVPILGWIRKYNMNAFLADLIAGLTVGLTILPQGLAYASLAGIPPQIGLYSGFVGCFVYILFGSTKAVTIGPTASMAIIALSYSSGKPWEYTVMLCFVTGLVTLALGLLQLGFIANFISTPMISGFTSAVAITIISTQIKSLLGLRFKADGVIEVIQGTVEHIDELKWWDTVLSVVCIVTLLGLQRLQTIFACCASRSKILNKILWFISTSRNAIVVVVCTAIFTWLGDPVKVEVIGDIVPGLPTPGVPHFKFNDTSGVEYSLSKLLKQDTSVMIVLPILALMEHITIAKALAGTSRVDATQELITIGLSNLIGAFFISMPVTGSFSRTSVNHASGVQTPMGGLVTGVLVLMALQFLTPYFYYIPNATLASVIVCAVIFTIDVGIIKPMWRSKKTDFIPWGVTFLVSVFIGLHVGILSGFLISLVFLLYYSARPGVRISRGETSTGVEFILAELDRSLVFPSVEYTNYILIKSATVWARGRLPIVLDCNHIQFADYSAAQGVKQLFTVFNAKQHELILWRLKPSVVRIITGVMETSRTPFKHCSSEKELEAMLEEAARRHYLPDKDHDIKIVFTMHDDDEELSSSSSDDADQRDYQI